MAPTWPWRPASRRSPTARRSTRPRKPDTPKEKRIHNDVGKIINGQFENWYWAQKKDDQPWMSNVKKFPAAVEIDLPKPTEVARVIVYAAPPWQLQGSLLKYELQYDDDGNLEDARQSGRADEDFQSLDADDAHFGGQFLQRPLDFPAPFPAGNDEQNPFTGP